MSEQTRKAIIDAIRQAVGKTGRKAFFDSQCAVPVVTGMLKSSGSMSEDYTGFVIKYVIEYASLVERGWEGGVVWTNSHTRRDGTKVKGHYKNQPAREGKHFIGNSMRKSFIGETGSKSAFQQDFIATLRDLVQPAEVKEE
jgi:hypothetical protein